MSPEDATLFQHVQKLYNSGQHDEAYRRFRELHDNGNQRDTALLCWIGYSTPDLQEAQRALADVERLNPYHRSLPKLRKRVSQLQKQQIVNAPRSQLRMLWCPNCDKQGMMFPSRKVSILGWLVFSLGIILFFPARWREKALETRVWICASCGSEFGNGFAF